MSVQDAIAREWEFVRRTAGAPQPVRLGCSQVTHDRMDFCSACTCLLPGGGAHLELLGWRLLAIQEAAPP